jgi:sugar lactone lactonase YvrE
MRRTKLRHASSRRPSIGRALGLPLPLFWMAIGCAGSDPIGSPAAGSGGVTVTGSGGTGGSAESGGTSSAGTGAITPEDGGAGGPPDGGGTGGSIAGSGGAPAGGTGGTTTPGREPPVGPGPYAGMRPEPETPASIGNTRIFDDLAGLVWNQTAQELLIVVGQNNKILRYRAGVPDADNFDVVRPGAEHLDGMKGIDFGPDGALWVCEARSSLPPRVSRSDGAYDRPVTVVDQFQDSDGGSQSFTSPWYVTVRWDGNAYFTDTPHRYSGIPNKRLFRVDPAGKLTLLKRYAKDSDLSEGGAFGIALSPNQRAFYISTWNHPGHPQLVRFDLAPDGAVAKETLVMTDTNGPIQSVDGLCIDQAENIYLCTGGGGVRMYGPAGALLGTIAVPGATDCTFGGADMKSLFVATSGGVAGDKNLYQVPNNIPGLP